MAEVYNSQTKESLLASYIEARESHSDALSDEVWDKLVEMDRKESKERLAQLRTELNNGLELVQKIKS